jgi:hypothetical protein
MEKAATAQQLMSLQEFCLANQRLLAKPHRTQVPALASPEKGLKVDPQRTRMLPPLVEILLKARLQNPVIRRPH